MLDDATDDIEELCTREQTIVDVQPAAESLQAGKFDDSATTLIEAMQPTEGLLDKVGRKVQQSMGRPQMLIGGMVCAVLAFVAFLLAQPPILVEFGNILQSQIDLINADKSVVPRRWTIIVLVVTVLGFAGTFIGQGAYSLTQWLAPVYGQTVTVVITTDGDGGIKTGYLVDPGLEDNVRGALKKIAPNATVQTKETTSLADWIGLTEYAAAADDNTLAESPTSICGELVYREAKPYLSMQEGRTAAELVDDDGDDTGLPPDDIRTHLANQDVPAVVLISATARRADASRADRIHTRLPLPFESATIDDSSRIPTETPVTTLCDISVQGVFFTGDRSEIAPLCQGIRAALAGPMNDGIEDTEWRLAPADARLRSILTRPHRVSVLGETLVTNQAHYRGANRMAGLYTRLDSHTRTAIPATPAEFWRYFAVTGTGLDRTMGSSQERERDQTETSGPPEAKAETLRKAESTDTEIGYGENVQTDTDESTDKMNPFAQLDDLSGSEEADEVGDDEVPADDEDDQTRE